MTARSMQTQQQGIEVAGHNMANVNNPGYARQRIAVQTAPAIRTANNIQGTGSDTRTIEQIRNVLLDNQIVVEGSVLGSLDAQQQALQTAQANLGQALDRSAAGAEGTAAAAATGTQHGIGDSITDLFNSFQSLSTQPSSLTERDIVLNKATQLANRFQQTDQRLAALNDTLNQSIETDVEQVNGLLDQIAEFNHQIGNAEASSDGVANDIRDSRQAALEKLSKLIRFDALPSDEGAIDISVGGVTLLAGSQVAEHIEAYDAGGGQMMIRSAATGTNMTVTGGSIHGAIEARDGAVQTLRDNLSALAGSLITEINRVHQAGFGLNGSTGLNFFEGSNASDIRVNADLIATPAALQASDSAGEVGNNGIILAMAQLARTPQAALGNQTFSQNYSRVVAGLGESLSSVNEQITDQTVVSNMLSRQRDAYSAVSIDEEMTDLIKYQKAYQASAQLVNVVNTLLDTVLSMLR